MKDIVSVLFRRKREFLLVFWGTIAAIMLLAYIVPPTYQAEATLLLKPGRFKKPFIPDEANPRTHVQVSMEDVGSEVMLIESRPVLEEVVDNVLIPAAQPPDPAKFFQFVGMHMKKLLQNVQIWTGLSHRLSEKEALLTRLSGKLQVDYIKRTNIIQVSYKSSDPSMAAATVNSLVDAYIRHHVRLYGNIEAYQVARQTMEHCLGELQMLEDSLRTTKVAERVFDIQSQYDGVLEQLARARNNYQLLLGLQTKDVATAELANLTGDPAFLEMSEKLTDAEIRKINLLTRFGSKDNKVVAARREIYQLRGHIDERFRMSLAAWKTLVDYYEEKLAELELKQSNVSRLERQIEHLEGRYLLTRDKVNELLVSAAMDEANVASARVVAYASESDRPAFPNRKMLLFVSLFMGTMLGMTYAFSRDRLSMRLFSVSDVEASTALPVLVSLPEFGDASRDALDRQCGRHLIGLEKAIPVDSDTTRLTLFTSPSFGAGTSFVCEEAARYYAQQGGSRVLQLSISDHPEQGQNCTPLPLDGNFEQLLRAIEPPSFQRAYGSLCINTAEAHHAAGTVALRALVEFLKAREYTHLFIDLSSHDADPLYLTLARVVDGVVIVVGYNHSHRHALRRMINQLESVGAPVAGVVFNRRVNEIPEPVYRHLL